MLQQIPSPESPGMSFGNFTNSLGPSIFEGSSNFVSGFHDCFHDTQSPDLGLDESDGCAGSGLLDFTFNSQGDSYNIQNKSSIDPMSDSATTNGTHTSAPDLTNYDDVLGFSMDPWQPAVSQRHGALSLSVLNDNNSYPKYPQGDLLPTSRRRFSNSSAPSALESAMATKVNNHSISENLLHIYHDVLEHNLSCWLTEKTCPYRGDFRTRKVAGNLRDQFASLPELVVEGPQPGQEEGKWSNRIYHRVIKLDKIAQSTGLIQLTRTQTQTAQRALHLVIMAFATQWALNSRRQREGYTTDFADIYRSSFPEEFDRHLQRSLWRQARDALQDCADIESYRIVCAELIFGLTQKPWEEDDILLMHGSQAIPTENDRAANLTRASIFSEVAEILAKEGPPIFMERAARKMHTLKFKFDSQEAGLMRIGDVYRPQPNQPRLFKDSISPQDRETVGLLYWLAVMFDTISSSMNERPVVVADEDSQHEAAGEVHPADGPQVSTHDYNKSNNHRWRIDLFIQDNPERSLHSQLRWPCSYDEAANMVTRSAPVKVLLYRYVHYLQTKVRVPKKTRGQPMEEGIRDALLVYRYWNVTYGPFFRDLIEQYNYVPSRIRGWFVCIVAHWHLASLMLADLIELIDDNGLGLASSMQARISAHTVACIRKSSAGQLSDLAKVATPSGLGHSQTEPQLPDFHFAVREGTILTEPWTMILIRAFTKAAMLHLQEMSDIELRGQNDILGHDGETLSSCLRRCEECIRALWFLGKKSDSKRFS